MTGIRIKNGRNKIFPDRRVSKAVFGTMIKIWIIIPILNKFGKYLIVHLWYDEVMRKIKIWIAGLQKGSVPPQKAKSESSPGNLSSTLLPSCGAAILALRASSAWEERTEWSQRTVFSQA